MEPPGPQPVPFQAIKQKLSIGGADVARISDASRAALPEDAKELWDRFTTASRDFTHQAQVLAHSPEAFRHVYGLIEDLRASGTLSPRLVEIAVVTTSRLNACPYCVAHHAPVLAAHGLSAAAVEGILEPAPDGLTAGEVLVRDYARLLTERPWGIPDGFFSSLREHFSERQIVELTVRIGMCSLLNKLNLALEIEPEATLAGLVERETR